MMTLRRVYLFMVGAHIIAGLLAVYIRRPLITDGYVFLSHILQNGRFGIDGQFKRYINVVLQIPSVIISRYMTFIPDWNSWATVAFCATYALHPYISWGVCYLILRKFNKAEYIVFPLLSYALITIPMMTYPSVTMPETISTFWPLFFLLTLSPLQSRAAVLGVSALTFLLANAYEAGLIFFFVNIAILHTRRQWGWPLILQILGVLWMVYRLYEPQTPTSGFMDSLLWGDFTLGYRLFTMTAVLSVIALILKPQRWVLALAVLACAFSLYWGLYEIWDTNIMLDEPGPSRTRAAPLVAIVSLMAFWSLQKKRSLKILQAFCVFALAVSLVYDAQLLRAFDRMMDFSRKFAQENPGCNVMSIEDFNNQIFKEGHSWWFRFTVAQPDRFLSPPSVAFAENPITGDSCRVKNSTLGIGNDKQPLWTLSDRFDYSKILNGPIHHITWNPSTKSWDKKDIER